LYDILGVAVYSNDDQNTQSKTHKERMYLGRKRSYCHSWLPMSISILGVVTLFIALGCEVTPVPFLWIGER